MIAAIVPAAGASRRMGQPKLILPIGGTPLIARVVTALKQGGAEVVVVVSPPADAPGASALIGAAAEAGARLIVPPAPTLDMRTSVTLALDHLATGPAPEGILLTPGDHPGLTSALVAQVIAHARRNAGRLVVPATSGRRGHPIAIPWPLAATVPQLPLGAGINALLSAHASEVVELEVENARPLADLDTPEDYEHWNSS